MTKPTGRRWQAIFAGAAALAILALFNAAPFGTGQTSVASGSVRLVDRATDLPPPPGVVGPPGVVVMPGGLPMPPMPPGVELPPEVPQMLQRASQVLAWAGQGAPPNVPNEVCRFNTVRITC